MFSKLSKVLYHMFHQCVNFAETYNTCKDIMLEIKQVDTDKGRKAFVDFLFRLYRDSKNWVPPIKRDELKLMKPETNPFFHGVDARFWLAWQDGKPVGRIAALINHAYNEKNKVKMGRVSRVEFVDDTKVSEGLFEVAENWLREQGMTKVHGPLGFNNLDNQGCLIEGFEYLPSIASVYHKPYYLRHFERLGYEKENDWVEFRLSLGEKAVKKGSRGAALVKKRYGYEVISFNSTKEMVSYIHPLFNILNQAFTELPYTSPFTDEMIDAVGEKYFKVLNPKFVRVIKKDGEMIAFVVGLPSLSKAMQKAKGKLFPFGVFHILRAMKKPEVIDLLLTGVLPEYQSAGAAVLLFGELQDEMLKQGVNIMETTGVFETNHNVIANWKNYDHIQHKRRRCWVKSL